MRLKFIDKFFIKYFFIVYYLYIMSVNVIIPKKSLFGLVFNMLMLVFLIISCLDKSKQTKQFSVIYIYILFIGLLILLQSSDYVSSYANLARYSIGLLSFPVGFAVISSLGKFRQFQKTALLLLLLYLINITVANLLNLGSTSGYGVEDGIQLGNVFSEGLYINAFVFVSIFLLIILFPKHKILVMSICVICALLIFVNMKRMAIAVLCGGFIFYVLHYNYMFGINSMSKFQNKLVFRILILFFLIAPFFYGFFMSNFLNRQYTFEKTGGIENEGRVLELSYIYSDIKKSPIKILFGQETFNLIGTYAGGRYGQRPMHNDYAIFLNGTGIVGVLFTLSIYLYIMIFVCKLRSGCRLPESSISSMLYSLFITYMVMRIVMLFSGTLAIQLSTAFFFAYMGAIARYFYNRNYYCRMLELEK